MDRSQIENNLQNVSRNASCSLTTFVLLISCFLCDASLHAKQGAVIPYSIENFTLDHGSVLRTRKQSKPYVVLHTGWGMGFFSGFLAALGAVRLYEDGRLSGVSIEYGTSGTYYDPTVGLNWWEYYFEPLHIGNRNNGPLVFCGLEIILDDIRVELHGITEFHTFREDAHRLINQYIKVKPHIEEKVNQIVEDSFGYSSIIGVHYRGTDKWTEAPIAPYDNVAAHVDEIIAQLQEIGHSDIKIFIATDEQNFLDYMRVRYPSKVVCYEESERSIDGVCVHLSGTGGTPYQKGEDALIDCLLLAKTDILLKTSSNLSLCATYFNPDIPVIHMTSRHWHLPLE